MLYTVRCDGGGETQFTANSDDEAAEEAREWLREGDWDLTRTIRVHGFVLNERGPLGSVSVTIDPDEPECAEGQEHDWQSPLEIVGGIDSNPGVWGSNHGGVSITSCCMLCGCKRTVDTGGTDHCDGSRLETTTYEPEFYVAEINALSADEND